MKPRPMKNDWDLDARHERGRRRASREPDAPTSKRRKKAAAQPDPEPDPDRRSRCRNRSTGTGDECAAATGGTPAGTDARRIDCARCSGHRQEERSAPRLKLGPAKWPGSRERQKRNVFRFRRPPGPKRGNVADGAGSEKRNPRQGTEVKETRFRV